MERIELADWIMGQSFGGSDTRLMQAIEVCLRDIRQAKQAMDQEELPAAEVLLISDGRSTLLPYVQEDVRQSGIQLHVVCLGSFRNAELEALAASYSNIPDAHRLQVAVEKVPADGRPIPTGKKQPATRVPV